MCFIIVPFSTNINFTKVKHSIFKFPGANSDDIQNAAKRSRPQRSKSIPSQQPYSKHVIQPNEMCLSSNRKVNSTSEPCLLMIYVKSIIKHCYIDCRRRDATMNRTRMNHYDIPAFSTPAISINEFGHILHQFFNDLNSLRSDQ